MRLYTEEQVRCLLNKYFSKHGIDGLLEQMSPIELPSEEDIKKSAEWLEGIERLAWREGAKWVINQIKQQDNGK